MQNNSNIDNAVSFDENGLEFEKLKKCLAGKKEHYVGGADGITYEMICALSGIYNKGQ